MSGAWATEEAQAVGAAEVALRAALLDAGSVVVARRRAALHVDGVDAVLAVAHASGWGGPGEGECDEGGSEATPSRAEGGAYQYTRKAVH